MATNLSNKGLEVSASAHDDIPTGGSDKVLLYASGSGSNTRLYVKSGEDTQKQLGFDIDQFAALGGTGLHQTQDHFLFSDNGTEKKITFSNLQDAIFADVSGDATIAAGGALTIAAQAVENSMLADDAVGADELAANAVVNASIASNAAIDMDKLDGGSLASSLSDLAQGDLLYAGDADASNALKSITFSNLEDAIFGNVSGDATIAAGGALTIAANAVEDSMVNDNVATGLAGVGLGASSGVLAVQVSGAVHITNDKVALSGTLAGSGLTFTGDHASIATLALDIDELNAKGDASLHQTDDHFLVSDGGTEKKISFSNLQDAVFADVSGDATIAAGGALTIAAGAVEEGMLNDNVISGQAELAHADIVDADELLVSDGGTLKRVGVDSLQNHYYGNVSGDATIADGGALTIAANAVEDSMVNDNVATGLAGHGLVASSGVLAVQVSGAVGLSYGGGNAKLGLSASFAGDGLAATGGTFSISSIALDIDGMSTAMTGDLADTDEFAISDGGTMKKVDFSVVRDAVFADVSGDATVAAGGALTIAADAVESGMLNDNVISGQVEVASDALNAADEMMISDGGTLKKIGVDNLFKDGPGLLSAADVDVSADHIVFLDGGATGDAKIESINDLATGMAGDGLSAGSGALAVSVDDSSIETNSDALRVKAGGIQTSMLADDAVDADKLASNAVVNASVASNAAIAATKVNFSVDLGGNILFGTQADDTVAFTGPIKAGGNTIADSGNNAAITLDGSGGMSTLGGFGGGSGVTFASSGGAQFATAVTVNKSDGSMSNDFKVFGDTAGAHFMYDASADKGLYHNGTAQVLELGTSANGFAIEVANLAGDAGKIKATAFVTYSDESLKQEVTAMDNALDAVMSLNGVEFTWKNSGQRDFGFLAQEVKNVIPQAVSVGNDGIHGVDYSRLTSVLVEAVKAQQVQIEELKALLKK